MQGQGQGQGLHFLNENINFVHNSCPIREMGRFKLKVVG